VLTGAAVAEIAVVAVLALLFSRLNRRLAASVLLLTGMAWFFLRLRS